ncbi:MAG: DUF3488 and transglutaminase-like domain-containing protein [Oscillospiraceae bacterium]|nr:DUF3488 and transglutaminase-like domain-containing protein [Oscillospiraceae bacterium]
MSTKPISQGKHWDFLFFTFVGIFYAWALSESVLTATILVLPFWQLLFYCAVFVVVLGLIFYNRYTALGGLGFLILAGGGVFFYLYTNEFDVAWFAAFMALLEDFYEFAFAFGPYRDAFATLAAWGLAFLFSLVTVLNTRLHYGFFSLVIMAVGVIAMPIYMGWDSSPTAILVMLFCLFALLAKRLFLNATQRQEGEPLPGSSRYAMLLIPLCLLIFGVGWVLPKPDAETIDTMNFPDVGGAMDNLMHAISPEQTLSFTDGGSRLGGPANLNDLVVMIVDSDERLYLAGATRDYYTGHSWLTTDRTQLPLDPDENGIFGTDPNPESLRRTHDYLRRFYGWPIRQATITTGDVRTDTIFTPPAHQTLKLEEDLRVTQNAYGDLRTSRALLRESSYTFNYIGWNRESPYFSNILREYGHIVTSNVLGGRLDHDRAEMIAEIDAVLTQQHAGMNADELALFLQLPDTLPDRVGALARELTADEHTTYDRLRALERYLARFPYTLNAPQLPMGEDFVDHFLFTGREGYCVHYATAMVVMARTLGIPARYIEGYITPEFPAADGMFWVTNNQAHAWVEAYITGFGWVLFEPTSAYHIGNTPPPAGWEPPIPPELPEEPQSPPDHNYDQDDIPVMATPENIPEEAGQESGFPWGLLFTPVILAGGGYLAYIKLTARYRAKQSKLESLPNREAVLALFAATLGAAEASGLPIGDGETALGYAERMHTHALFFGQGSDLRQLAGIYSKAAYSAHEVTSWERAATLKGRDSVLKRLTASRKNLPRYWLDRYILLRY